MVMLTDAASEPAGSARTLEEIIADQERAFCERQPRSAALTERAARSIPGGASSNWAVSRPAIVWVDRGDGSSFALEAFIKLRSGNFHGDGTIKASVSGLVHITHPTRTNRRENFVRTELFAGRERHVIDLA